MNDRELLELAAKAAGLVIGFSKTSPEQGRPYVWNDEKKTSRWWNPIEDDGDALRLAVNLRISVSIGKDVVEAYIGQSDGKLEVSKSNLLSATRRAIVRAAAEIGRKMKNGEVV